MDYQQVADDTRYNVRTQVSLSVSMYRAIKEEAKNSRKSLSQVLREGYLVKKLIEEKNKKADKKWLEDWVKRTKGSSKPGDGGWGDVNNPHKLIRKEREDEEAILAKRYGWPV